MRLLRFYCFVPSKGIRSGCFCIARRSYDLLYTCPNGGETRSSFCHGTLGWPLPLLWPPGWAELEANDFLVILVLVIIIAVPFFLYRRR